MSRLRFLTAASFAVLAMTTPCLARYAPTDTMANHATTGDQKTVGTVLDAADHSSLSTSAFRTGYTTLLADTHANTAGEASSTLQSLTPTTAFAQEAAIQRFGALEDANLMNRMRALRTQKSAVPVFGTKAVRLSSGDMATSQTRMPASAGDPVISPAMVGAKSNSGSWLSGIFGSDDSDAAAPSTAPVNPRDAAYQKTMSYPGQPLSGLYGRKTTAATRAAARGYAGAATGPAGTPLPGSYAMVTDNARTSATNLGNGAKDGAKPTDSTDAGQYVWAPNNRPAASNPEPVIMPVQDAAAQPLTPISADRRWGVFMSTGAGFGSGRLQSTSPDARSTTAGVTLGVDRRITDNGFMGLAFTYAHNSFTTGQFADLQSNSYGVSLYGTTTFLHEAYFDGYLSAGVHNFDSDRTLDLGDGLLRTANGTPTANHVTARGETGYNFKDSGWTFGPFGGMKVTYASLEGFSESGVGFGGLTVHDRSAFSNIGSLGVGANRSIRLADGSVLTPSTRLAYNHEFGDGLDKVKADFEGTSMQTFTTRGATRSRDWLSLAPSITATLPNDWQLHASYTRDVMREDVDASLFDFGASYSW